VSKWTQGICKINALFQISQAKILLVVRRYFLMGSAGRIKPEKLGIKLKAIRNQLGDSFTQMAGRLSDKKITVLRTDVSRYEKGLREPSLIILLRYAKLVGTTLDTLADDEVEFPVKKE
jgi:DNA-binding XRE family transcriptional regulator